MIDSESRCALYEHHKLSSIRAAIGEDIARFATFSPEYKPKPSWKTTLSIFLKPALLCVFCYRIGHFLYVRRWSRLARVVSGLNLIVHKANLPAQSCIGPGCFLGHCTGISFHGTAGRNLTMLSLAVCCPKEDSFGGPAVQGPRLGDGVTVGGNAVVMGPVNIGDNVKIAPTTALSINCPPDVIAFSARLRFRQRPRSNPPVDTTG